MMPWRDQLRVGLRVLRWMCWPEDQRIWANVADLVIFAALFIAVTAQIWLGLLAGLFLWFAVGFAGRKGGA
jgi:hypothetical protein